MSRTRYHIPANPCRCEIEVNRSRFIATIEMVETPEAAQEFVSRLKQEFPTANHNCWAYLCGPPGSTDRIGLSDDGEPHGVAGKPLLTTLQHSGLGDIAVVVTRYFGGIKLGKGGMVKAYTEAVQNALNHLQTAEKIDWAHVRCHCPYNLFAAVERLLPEYEADLLDQQFAEQVSLEIKVPAETKDTLLQRLTDLSAGQITFESC